MTKISPEEILKRVAEGITAIDWLRHEVETEALLCALDKASTDHERVVLCDVLGWRHEHQAVSRLVTLLDHDSSKVRSSVADALAKIGDPSVGAAVLQRLQLPDPSIHVRRMLLATLGAVNYREAIPLLIQFLQNPDPSQRGSAAWSLGAMRAVEALPALETALHNERSRYPRERMTVALKAIRNP